MNMKKVLTAATILTALATTAFAAEVQDNCKPSMHERVNKILHENDRHPAPEQRAFRGYPERPHMTQEQREAFQKMSPAERKALMKERHEQWLKSMTPEQRERYDKHQKFMKERRENHKKLVADKMSKLTKAQRAEVEQFIKDDFAHRKAMDERLKKMTPAQREAIRVSMPHPFGQHGPRHFDKKGFGPKMHPHYKGMGHGPQHHIMPIPADNK